MECVRPDFNAQLLRVTVESGFRGDKSSKVVLWGGPRSEVWEQGKTGFMRRVVRLLTKIPVVTVGNLAPRWQYLPIWLPIVVSLFFSYVFVLFLPEENRLKNTQVSLYPLTLAILLQSPRSPISRWLAILFHNPSVRF